MLGAGGSGGRFVGMCGDHRAVKGAARKERATQTQAQKQAESRAVVTGGNKKGTPLRRGLSVGVFGPLEAGDAGGFVVECLEDRVQLRDLQQILNLRLHVQQLHRAAFVRGRRVGRNQLT